MSNNINIELLDKAVMGITSSHRAEAGISIGQRRSRAISGAEGGNPLQQHPLFARQPVGKADASLNNSTAVNPETQEQMHDRANQLTKSLQLQLGLGMQPDTAPKLTVPGAR